MTKPPEVYIDSRMHAVLQGHIPLPKREQTNVLNLDFPRLPRDERRFWINLLDKVIPAIIAKRNVK